VTAHSKIQSGPIIFSLMKTFLLILIGAGIGAICAALACAVLAPSPTDIETELRSRILKDERKITEMQQLNGLTDENAADLIKMQGSENEKPYDLGVRWVQFEQDFRANFHDLKCVRCDEFSSKGRTSYNLLDGSRSDTDEPFICAGVRCVGGRVAAASIEILLGGKKASDDPHLDKFIVAMFSALHLPYDSAPTLDSSYFPTQPAYSMKPIGDAVIYISHQPNVGFWIEIMAAP
jgi:hypothetical protein